MGKIMHCSEKNLRFVKSIISWTRYWNILFHFISFCMDDWSETCDYFVILNHWTLFYFFLREASSHHIIIAANDTIPAIINSTDNIGEEININYLVRDNAIFFWLQTLKNNIYVLYFFKSGKFLLCLFVTFSMN